MALNKAQFFNNVKIKHEHGQRITNLNFSDNSNYMVTISNDMTKIWKIVSNLLGVVVTIESSHDVEHKDENALPLACIDNACSLVAVYRGKLNFVLYTVSN